MEKLLHMTIDRRHPNCVAFILGILFILGFGMLAMADHVAAASASLTMALQKEDIKEEDTFTVTVTLTSSVALGSFEATLGFDEDMVTCLSENSLYTVAEGNVVIEDTSFATDEKSRKYVLEFKAKAKGSTDLAVKGTPIVIGAEEKNTLSVSKNVLMYEISGIGETSEIGKAEETESAEQKGTQNPSDSQKPEETKQPEEIVKPEELETLEPTVKPVSSAVPDGEKQLEGFVICNGQYELLPLSEAKSLPQGYQEIVINMDGQSVTGLVSKKDPSSDFILVYAKVEDGQPMYYRYDQAEATMQRYVEEEVKDSMLGNTISRDEYNNRVQVFGVVLLSLIATIIILLTVIIRMVMKKKGYQDELE